MMSPLEHPLFSSDSAMQVGSEALTTLRGRKIRTDLLSICDGLIRKAERLRFTLQRQ